MQGVLLRFFAFFPGGFRPAPRRRLALRAVAPRKCPPRKHFRQPAGRVGAPQLADRAEAAEDMEALAALAAPTLTKIDAVNHDIVKVVPAPPEQGEQLAGKFWGFPRVRLRASWQ